MTKVYKLGRIEKGDSISHFDYLSFMSELSKGSIESYDEPSTEELINKLRDRWYIKMAIRFNKDIRAVFNSVWVD